MCIYIFIYSYIYIHIYTYISKFGTPTNHQMKMDIYCRECREIKTFVQGVFIP